MISAIVYNSKTGSCERYAKELSHKLVIPCYAQGCFRPRADAKVIYVSWIMAGKVVGLSKAVKKMDVGAVVAVGMAPAGKKAAEAMRQASGLPAHVGFFLVQGGFHIDKLPLPMKLIMRWKVKDIAARLEEKKRTAPLSAQEQATYEMAKRGDGEPAAWDVDEIVAWVMAEFDDEKILRQH